MMETKKEMREKQLHFFEHVSKLRIFFRFFFSVQLLSILRGHSVFSSPPQRQMNFNFAGFSIPDVTHYIYFFPVLILEKEPVFSLFIVEW